MKHFLKQCIHSVIQAVENISHEIICVDNNSVDGSGEMLKQEFPNVILIKNKVNVGFAKACNQGIKISNGEYVLMLNPDTVLENDSLLKPVQYMDAHPEVGSLGVKMLDGNGKFLPESKRGLPTPAAAFYKMSGLSKLFYPSKIFGKYYLDHLNKNETQYVHVLSGAYMLLRKKVLDEIGYFDEQFFMYGEDVDLSHRIIKAGYKNVYFPETRIIHYKGESTKKESVKYVFSFYKAMLIFSKKHFSKNNSKILSILLNTAIIFRAFLDLVLRFLKSIIFPLLDFAVIGIGLIFITKIWEAQVTYPDGGSYPLSFYQFFIPFYTLSWLAAIYLLGGYDKPFKLKKIIWGVFTGSIFILLAYSLLTESLRFSRSIILLGSAWSLFSLAFLRFCYRKIGIKHFIKEELKRIIIVGNPDETSRIAKLLEEHTREIEFLGFVSPSDELIKEESYLGSISSIKELIKFYNISELIFCSKDLTFQQIIDHLSALQKPSVKFKIAPENTFSVIGSNSILNAEDLYMQEILAFSSKTNIRAKRIFDVLLSIMLIISIPLNIFLVANFNGFLKNIGLVLRNRKTWVGFHPQKEKPLKFVHQKTGILFTSEGIKNFNKSAEAIDAVNMGYAQKYHFFKDLQIVYLGFKRLGRQ